MNESRKGIAIHHILRTMLEAQVDLENLCRDQGYADNVQANYLHEWLRVLKEAGKESNPYLQGLSDLP